MRDGIRLSVGRAMYTSGRTDMTARAAFLRACELDVAVRKPGNVSRASPGHRMQAAQFLASARAAADALFAPGARVGERIEGAVAATLAAAGCNTNLGIVLLAAPIAAATERAAPASSDALCLAIAEVLAGLDIDDAIAAYRAIALARPGGLGRVGEADVHAAPGIGLREAMRLAAARDSIARQYDNGFADLFETGLPALRAANGDVTAAVQRVFLTFLARWPDSHIVRKFSAGVAQRVMNDARAWLERAHAGAALDADPAFTAWDEALKAQGINPGTSADLTVATLMLDGLSRPADTR
jgi:triphosphoribosyl-dephospho-CoA synthase